MKLKYLICTTLLLLLASASQELKAIDYPEYNASKERRGFGAIDDTYSRPIYSGYSTIATGGTTTYGEGSSSGNSRRSSARRANYGGPKPPASPNEGDTWTDPETGEEFEWNGTYWDGDWGTIIDPPAQDYGSPVGDPTWPMLVFVLMAAGVICVRRIYSFGEKKSEIEEK